jgi:hypothetical protein
MIVRLKFTLSPCFSSYRQKLRESSVELRNLEAQLRTAYVSKELAAQLAEKKSARLEEKVRKLN